MVTQYDSRSVVQLSGQSDAGIIRHIAARNWTTAANLISMHPELMEELKLRLLDSIHRDIKNRSKQKEDGPGPETDIKEMENSSVQFEEEPIEFSFVSDVEYEKKLRRAVESKRKERQMSYRKKPQKSGVQAGREEDTVMLKNTEEPQPCVEREEEQIHEFTYKLDEDFNEAESDISLDGHLESETEEQTNSSSENEDEALCSSLSSTDGDHYA